jgi:hypothetical protein
MHPEIVAIVQVLAGERTHASSIRGEFLMPQHSSESGCQGIGQEIEAAVVPAGLEFGALPRWFWEGAY